MLLQFAVENYLSFRDRAVLSMLADPRVAHAPGQILEGPGGRKVLRVAALYGANGSGKSNLVKALVAVQRMVEKGTRGDERLPIVPFKLDPAQRKAPAHFELELIAAGKHYSYGFEATAKQVEAEWLYEIDPSGEERLLFEREAGSDAPRITIGDALSAEPKRRAFLEFVAEGTRQNQLFLAEVGERNVTELEHVRDAIRDRKIVISDAPYLPHIDKLQLIFARAGASAAAQLVFTPHDTNLLDLRVLSRDSIWMVEKDTRGGSVTYPLSELDQAQLDEVERQGKGLRRGYLQGRFGGCPSSARSKRSAPTCTS